MNILTEREIEEGLTKGRVDSGGRELHQMVDEEAALANALQAFEDGIYLVILDGEEYLIMREEEILGVFIATSQSATPSETQARTQSNRAGR